MIRYLPALLILAVASPVLAQEATPVAPAAPAPAAEEISPERLELAKKMHEIWPIRTRIESAIDAVSKGFPEDKQAEIKAAMRRSIQFDQVEEASIAAMARAYTNEELQAMIDFYGSDMGRTISAKTTDYEMSLRPVLTQMIDRAMLDLRTGQAR